MRAVNGVSPSGGAQSRYGSSLQSPFSGAPGGVEMTPTTKALYHFGGPGSELGGAQPQPQRRKRPAMNPLNFDAAPDDSVLERRMKRIAGAEGVDSGPLGLGMPE